MTKLEFYKQPEKGSMTLTLRINNDTNAKLEKLAGETGISKNAIINRMIQFGLENYIIKE